MLILAAMLLQSTTCTTISGITRCDTQPSVNQPRFVPPIEYKTVQPDFTPLQTLGPAIAAKKERGRRKKVGKLIAAGKCDEAIAYALGEGEFELASYAKGYCGKL